MKTLRPRIATLGQRSSTGGWKPDEHRGNRHQRCYGYAWEQQRKRILERDNGLCQSCKRKGKITAGTQCDHRIARAIARILGWPSRRIEADENLETKCDDCHDQKTRIESNLIRSGSIEDLHAYVRANRGAG